MAFDRERLRQILGDTVSDDALGDILKAHSQSVSQDKGSITRMQQQLDAYAAKEAEWEQQRQAGLSDQERLQEALARAEATQAEYARKSARLDAEQVLVKAGMTADQYGPLLDSLVSEDSGKTVERANALVALVAAQSKAASDAAVRGMLASTPTPSAGTGNDGGVVTKERFDAMTYSEQVAFKAENPEAFRRFTQL